MTSQKLLLFFASAAERRLLYLQIIREQDFGSPLQQYVPEQTEVAESSAILKARHRATGQKVCLKAIYKDVDIPEISSLTEVILLERLAGEHNIVKFVECFEQGSFIYYAYGLMNCDLQSYLR